MGGGQSLTSAVKLAATLARQWMGLYISPEAIDDGTPPPLPPPLPLSPPSPPPCISQSGWWTAFLARSRMSL